jgi:GcrA cell cycle regulator
MNERILSDDEIEALRKHWATAPTIDEAAKRLGICRDTASLWARKLGLVRPNNSPWTLERTERLIALTKAGCSGSVIAAKLGVSRNSVIGKISRLGMQLGNCRNGMRQSLQSELRKPNRPSPNKRRKVQVKSKPVFEKAPIPVPTIDDVARVTFPELEAHHCKYPIGDPRQSGFGFCGLERIPGSPYCMPHTRISRVATPQNSIFGRVSVPAKEAENA